MKETKDKTLVIDADVVLYRACYLSEREIKWSDDIWTLQSDFNEAKKSVIDQIEGIMNTSTATRSCWLCPTALRSVTTCGLPTKPTVKTSASLSVLAM